MRIDSHTKIFFRSHPFRWAVCIMLEWKNGTLRNKKRKIFSRFLFFIFFLLKNRPKTYDNRLSSVRTEPTHSLNNSSTPAANTLKQFQNSLRSI